MPKSELRNKKEKIVYGGDGFGSPQTVAENSVRLIR